MVAAPDLRQPSVLHTNIAHVSKSAAGAHTHTQYVIRVTDERAPGLNWTVYRRYSEFRTFKARLENAVNRVEMCTQCSIMSKRTCFLQFPRRHLFRSLRERVLEERRVGLNSFLEVVTRHARMCKDRYMCQTRPLMDQFLMVSDMRYTFLDVNMAEVDEATALKLRHSEVKSEHTISTAVTSEPLSLRDASAETNPAEDDDEENQQQQPTVEPNRALHAASMPNLLTYTRDRSSRRSLSERPSLVADRDSFRYQPQVGGRHSDPGAAPPAELLSFHRHSIGSGRRSETARPRSRKVHLSSAAKRVKKLEEEESNLNKRQQQRTKKLVPMSTIAE